MPKKVFFDNEAREIILRGAKQIYEPVRSSLGPLGRNTLIHTQYQLPVATHDGVTIARSIDLPHKNDEHLGEVTGADLMRLAAGKVNDIVGDGTTTVTVLAYHLLNEANKLIAAGHNPMQLKRQLDAAKERVMGYLPKYIEKIDDNPAKVHEVALISAGGDKEIADIISEVMKQVGGDGSVTVEQSQGTQLTHEIVDGYKFDRGLVTPYMVTDNKRMRAVVENVRVLVTDQRISNVAEIIPILEKLAQLKGDKKIVVICEDMDGDALETLVKNKLSGAYATFAIKAPAFGDRRKEMLEDIATLVGAKVISREQGMELSEATPDMLGYAHTVIADRDSTVIVEGGGDKEDIQGRIDSLKDRAEKADSEFNKEKLEERAAALSGKVAIIKVGGVSETAIEERKFRVDDAVFATKAAIAQGIVPGGGVTLLNLVDEYSTGPDKTGEPGETILLNALEQPFVQLMDNSGHEGKSMRAEVRKSKKFGWGFSVYDPEKLVDLKKAGIVDPSKVTKEAVENAVSIAGTAMTMGPLVVDIPADLPPSPVMPR
jgi:chaperonin GroEL